VSTLHSGDVNLVSIRGRESTIVCPVTNCITHMHYWIAKRDGGRLLSLDNCHTI
jgi:hypothetical protein